MRDYISPSQINMYLRCPMQYKFRYIDELVLPPRAAMTKGKSVHRGIEYNMTQKIGTQQDLKLNDVLDFTAASFEEFAEDTEWEQSDDIGKTKDESISLVTLYHENIAPTIQPMMVEEKVEVDVNGIKLLGYIDLIDNNGYIHDTKTASRSPSQNEADKNLQLSAYALAYRELMGMPEKGVKLDYLVQTKKPKVVTLEACRTEQDIKRFSGILQSIAKCIENEIFYPNPTNMMCNERWCGYYHQCVGGK